MNRNLQNGIKPLTDWWFAGLMLLLYLFVQQIIGWQGEQLEWSTWFFGFIILILLFLLIVTEKFKPNLLFKFLFSLPFYIFLLYHWEFTYASVIFLLASVILWLGESYVDGNKDIQWQNIGHVLYYFVIFHIASKLVCWVSFTDFIWLKVRETSQYYEYSQIIELVTPALVHIIFFTSLLLFVFSVKKDFTWKPLMRYWWIIPVLWFIRNPKKQGFVYNW